MLENFLEYLKLEKRYSAHTISAYRTDLIEFYDFADIFHQEQDAYKLNFQQLRMFLVYLQNSRYSNRSINRKISSIKSFFKYLVKIGELKVNPSGGLSSLKQEKLVMVPYSKSEMQQLLDKIDFGDDFEGLRDRLMIEVFYNTGIRQSELIGLKLSSVDMANRQIKVLGKRNKERIIPVGDNLILLINKYLSYRSDLLNIEDNESFFLTKGGKQLYPSIVYTKINHYLSVITQKVKKSPHMIRHTFATHLMDAGADLNSIKELLGHSSLVATQVYTHSSIGKLKSIINKAHPRAKKE